MASNRKTGLGKGLDALFIDNSIEETSNSPVKLKITDIEPKRDQPRKKFDEEALRELSESISVHGVLQPLLVRPMTDGSYQLIAGERRWRAARMAGISEVPVVVREMSDSEAMEIALVENLQREDLNPIEEAKGFRLLMDTYSLTQEQAAQRVGKSRPAVANAMRLLSLPDDVIEYVEKGLLSPGHARALLPLDDDEKVIQLAQEIIKKGFSVRETEKTVKNLLSGKQKSTQKQKKRDTFFDEVELSVSDTLGRKAKINLSSAERGFIQIEFFSKEDLEKLMKIFDK